MAGTPVCFDLEPEQSSHPAFKGTKYDTVQKLGLISGTSRDAVKLNIQELSSLLNVISPMRRMHIAEEVKSSGD
jgi:hypothetical protein